MYGPVLVVSGARCAGLGLAWPNLLLAPVASLEIGVPAVFRLFGLFLRAPEMPRLADMLARPRWIDQGEHGEDPLEGRNSSPLAVAPVRSDRVAWCIMTR